MTGTRRFILFELNEVPLRVVRHFADRNPASSFAKILARGRHWTTVTPDQGTNYRTAYTYNKNGRA